jgi:tight adherence protein C
MPLIAIGLGAICAGSILIIVVALSRELSGNRVEARLNQFGRPVVHTLEEIELEKPFLERGLRPIVRRLSGATTRLTSASFAASTAKRLETAGNPGDLTVPDWLALKVIVGGLLGGGLFVLFLIFRSPLTTALIIGLGGVGIGFVGPEFWLRTRIRERKRLILKTLPDSLDLLTISVKAGLGFDAALQRVVDKVPGPLSYEFRIALAEIRVGKQRRDALRAILPRTDVKPLSAFIGAVLQAEALGVPIARVLQIQSEQIRIERRQRVETSAAKAPVKMLFPLVGCILPALFVVILGPAIILIAQNLP